MKYLVYYQNEFIEFDNKMEYEVFLVDKPNTRHKSCKTKKDEKLFRELCMKSPVFVEKIYIAIENGKPIRFNTWAECEEYRKTHPGLFFKSFTDNEAAQIFNNNNIHRSSYEDVLIGLIPEEALKGNKTDSIAYILRENDKVLYTEKLGSLAKLMPWERELKIVIAIIKDAINRKEQRVLIVYNNQGVELWANGSWNAAKPQSKTYKEEIDKLSAKINIDFMNINQFKKIDENNK